MGVGVNKYTDVKSAVLKTPRVILVEGVVPTK